MQDDARSYVHDDDESDEDRGVGGGFFAVGTNVMLGTSDLRDRLASAGYVAPGAGAVSFGGGGYGGVRNGLIFGGEGHGLTTATRISDGREVRIGGGYGLVTVGYMLQPAPQLRVYPQIGLGLGGVSLSITTEDAEQFDDILDQPRRSSEITQGNLLASVQGGAEYRFGGFMIGLQAGYLIAPVITDWSLGDTQLEGGPDATFSGPFVRLLIGGG
jgi:hypothetical protein